MVEIIPAVLTKNPIEAREMIGRCDGVVQRVQIDIIDGIFADNKTIVPQDLKGLDVFLGLDFHLMVDNPINWVEKCVGVGADRIIGQIEKMPSQKDFVEKVQDKNLRLGLALDLATPVEEISAELYSELDVVLLMAVPAGFGGQKFNLDVLKKVEKLSQIRREIKTPFRICVDGGEAEDVIDDSVREGADEIVIGRRLFNGDLTVNIKNMQVASLK
jgi:ribulose-phosphate 3-epimerase